MEIIILQIEDYKAFETEDLNLIQLGVSSNNESAIKFDDQFFDEFLMVKFR